MSAGIAEEEVNELLREMQEEIEKLGFEKYVELQKKMDLGKVYAEAKARLRELLGDDLCIEVTYRSREKDLAQILKVPYEAIRSMHAWTRKKLRSLGVERIDRGVIRVCGLDRAEEVLYLLLSTGYEVEKVRSLPLEKGSVIASKLAKYVLPVFARIVDEEKLLESYSYDELEKMLRILVLAMGVPGGEDLNGFPPLGAIAYEISRRNALRYAKRVAASPSF